MESSSRSLLRRFFTSFLKDEAGQGLAEYVLIVSLIAMVVLIGVMSLTGTVGRMFQKNQDEVVGAM